VDTGTGMRVTAH